MIMENKVIREMTDVGADYSFECIGLASLMEEAFKSTRPVRFYRFLFGLASLHG